MAVDIISLVSGASYPGLFLITAFLGYLIPVPEEVLLPTIGYLAYLGVYDFTYAAMAALAALCLSDNILFWLTRKKGHRFIDRLASRFRISAWQIERAKKYMHKNATLGLSVVRVIPGIKLLGPIIAGISGISWKRFQAFDMLGASIWVLGLMSFGFYFGSRMQASLGEISQITPILFLIVVLAATAYVFMNKKKITNAIFNNGN